MVEEITNDQIVLGLKLRVPLRCYLTGSLATISEGQSCVGMCIDRYTNGVVYVKVPGRERQEQIAKMKKFNKTIMVRVVIGNDRIIEERVVSILQIKNLETNDKPIVKLIKHIMNNDVLIKPKIEAMFKSVQAFESLITIKITSDMSMSLGLGFSANLSLIVASGLYLGLRTCFE